MEEVKGYDISEQLDHVAYMFNVRTKGKKYENFIVNAIYAKVDNPDLMPVTQQYVRNPKDLRKYYLLDLYFPQINFGVEIDEGQHMSDECQVLDKARTEAIKSAIGYEEARISIVDKKTGQKRSYSEISKDIDLVVLRIKQKIDDLGGVKWVTNEEKKRSLGIIKNGPGIFDIKQDVTYRSITEIYNICGGCRGTGKDAKSLQKGFYKLNNQYYLWVPTLTIEDNASDAKYNNYLSEDGTVITEINNNPKGWDNYPGDRNRVVFMRMKDMYGRSCIRFIGIFQYKKGDSKQCTHERIAKRVKITDLLP
jgi:very-short-patch-repair endonuclease